MPEQPTPKPEDPQKRSAFPEPPEWNYKPRGKPSPSQKHANYFQAGIGLSVAYSLIGSVIFGWLIGKLLDGKFGWNGLAQGLGTLLGAILGLVASVFLVLKAQRREDGR